MSTRLLFSFLFSIFLLGGIKNAYASADSVIVFNEIHYHPADEVNETEWFELRSLMGVDVDISGWAIDRGVAFDFPEGTIVPGHGYLIIAADPAN
ncbi:MAG: lamin tail domain-containing protein, partial [Akkermansiaceae bacterium]